MTKSEVGGDVLSWREGWNNRCTGGGAWGEADINDVSAKYDGGST